MRTLFFSLLLLSLNNASAAPAPDFTVTSSDNQVLKLYQHYISQGKVVVLEAFFTTCPPCNTHAPHVQNLYTQMLAQYPGKVEFILLSTLGSDTNVKVAQYKTSKNMTMPAAGSDGGSVSALQPYTSGQFGDFLGTPTFIVIAPNSGEVHFDIRGGSATQTMTLISQKIAELLPAPTPCILQDFLGNPLPEVDLRILNQQIDTTFAASGTYSLAEFPGLSGQTYTIKPSLNDNPLDGLTTYDLVLVSKHILGIEALPCDWQLLAADVNCSNSVTTFDIVTARKVILGILTSFPCGDAWRFAPDSSVLSSGDCQDFLAVKLGDVNGSPCDEFQTSLDDRSVFPLWAPDIQLQAGQPVQVDLFARAAMQLEGLQLRFHFDPAWLEWKDISSASLTDFDVQAFNVADQMKGQVPISWFDPAGVALAAGEKVLRLTLVPKQNGRLSELISLAQENNWPSEAYSADARAAVQLQWETVSAAVQLAPNPAKDICQVFYTAPYLASLHVRIFDVQGKLLQQQSIETAPGSEVFTLDLRGLPEGLYFVQVADQAARPLVVKS